MPDVCVLEVLLYGKPVGTLTLVQGSRTLFAFNQAYARDPARPTLSLSFKDQFSQLHHRHAADQSDGRKTSGSLTVRRWR